MERTLILNAYGVELLQSGDVPGFDELLEGGLSMSKLSVVMNKYANEHGYFYIDQGTNPDNPESHYLTTAPEIWEDTDGKVDYVVQLVGTGGTLAGISKYMKEKNPDIKIIAAQPAEASRRTPEHPNPNTIDGVLVFDGVEDEKVPPFFDKENPPYDECLDIVAEDAYETGRQVVKTDGIFLGQSASAAIKAATIIAQRPEAEGKNIVIILADNAFKYLSTNMYK
jgi:cysteine synthase A